VGSGVNSLILVCWFASPELILAIKTIQPCFLSMSNSGTDTSDSDEEFDGFVFPGLGRASSVARIIHPVDSVPSKWAAPSALPRAIASSINSGTVSARRSGSWLAIALQS
jgi:hypothetical protein